MTKPFFFDLRVLYLIIDTETRLVVLPPKGLVRGAEAGHLGDVRGRSGARQQGVVRLVVRRARVAHVRGQIHNHRE